jgi:hypothetical protein
MDDLPHSAPEELAKRLRALAAGLTNPADIVAVHRYADEIEREAEALGPKVNQTRSKAR